MAPTQAPSERTEMTERTMRKKIATASRIMLQAAIAVLPGGLVVLALYHLHRRWRMKTMTAATSTNAP